MAIQRSGADRAPGSDYAVGVGLVVTAAITFSTAGLFTKGVAAGAWDVIFWRGLFAAGFTTAWTAHKGTFRRNFTGLGINDWSVVLVGASGTAAFIPAFKFTSIANVSLIYAIAPLIAALLARLFIGERISGRTVAGCLGALAGVAIIVSGSFGHASLRGDLLALWMTVVMAVVIVIYRKYPDTRGGGPMALQSVVLLPVSASFGRPFALDPLEIGILAAFGLLFAVASVTLVEGAKRVPSGQTALLSALETPLAPVFAFLILSEVPNLATVLGGSVVLVAVLGSIRNDARRMKEPAGRTIRFRARSGGD